MRNIYLTTLIALAAFVASCNSDSDSLEGKKEKLASLNQEMKDLQVKITELEQEIQEADPDFNNGSSVRAVLVKVDTVNAVKFEHKTEVRGSVESNQNVMLTAEMSGKIMSIPVQEGTYVSRGATLIVLDAQTIRDNIAELKTSLELATTVYEKQKNLWDQKIGTEVQYLQAKNNKESLERKLATANTQLSKAIIRAPFSGTVDEIPAKVGELATPGAPLLRVVSTNNMYIKADVSESMLGKFKVGQDVEVYFPSTDKSVMSKVSSVGQVIKSENRTFEIQVQLPKVDFDVKPNQVVVLELSDYSNDQSVVVPTKVIQRDNRGNYVYQLARQDGALVADKVYVTPGLSYDLMTEIKEGLNEGQVIALEGFRELTPGLEVTIAK